MGCFTLLVPILHRFLVAQRFDCVRWPHARLSEVSTSDRLSGPMGWRPADAHPERDREDPCVSLAGVGTPAVLVGGYGLPHPACVGVAHRGMESGGRELRHTDGDVCTREPRLTRIALCPLLPSAGPQRAQSLSLMPWLAAVQANDRLHRCVCRVWRRAMQSAAMPRCVCHAARLGSSAASLVRHS